MTSQEQFSLPRREFIKLTAAATASSTLTPMPVMAGPFENTNDYLRLIAADKKLDPAWVKSLFERGEKEVYSDPKHCVTSECRLVACLRVRFISAAMAGFGCGTFSIETRKAFPLEVSRTRAKSFVREMGRTTSNLPSRLHRFARGSLYGPAARKRRLIWQASTTLLSAANTRAGS